MRALKHSLWLAILILAACATLPEQITRNSVGIQAAAETVSIRSNAAAIPLEQAESLQVIIHEADDFQTVAENAMGAGDLTAAQQALTFVNSILQAIEKRLNE